jgi:hypothetical protein
MVGTEQITLPDPIAFIAKDQKELADHLEYYENIPEIAVYQCQDAIKTVALDVAQRIFRPNSDARTLIGEYFTAQEAKVVPASHEATQSAATTEPSLPVIHGKRTHFVVTRSEALAV